MLFPNCDFGIIADNSSGRVSIFDVKTLEALQHIPLKADVIDVAITRDCSRAVVSSFVSKTMFQIDLCEKYAKVIGKATTDTFLEDVALTSDDRFALSVDGSGKNQDIVSYSLKKNAFVSKIPANAQAVAVSPKGNGLVLTVVDQSDTVHRFTIDRNGSLTDTGQEFPAGGQPINVIFSRGGNFAFVAGFSPGGVSLLSTILPDQITLISTDVTQSSQSMALSRDNRHLFLLGADNVYIYAFDPVAGHLTLERSFEHGLEIQSYYGVDQIALDASGTRLFISATGEVAVFTTYGIRLGSVKGVSGPGGIAICT
jgi:6-phosphogluconolactonase (cycloisomerase 2 family)